MCNISRTIVMGSISLLSVGCTILCCEVLLPFKYVRENERKSIDVLSLMLLTGQGELGSRMSRKSGSSATS